MTIFSSTIRDRFEDAIEEYKQFAKYTKIPADKLAVREKIKQLQNQLDFIATTQSFT